MKNTDREGHIPDGRPWSAHGPGPLKRLVGANYGRFNAERSQHHDLDDTDRQPFDQGWSGAILEPIPAALYDCFEIGPRGVRQGRTMPDPWEHAHGYHWRGFTDVHGKTEADISPTFRSGGQLPAPRMFDMRRMSCVFVPLLEWAEPRNAGGGEGPCQVRAPYAEHGARTARLRADIAAIKAAGRFRLQIGIKDYLSGPLALLPQPTGLVIPPQQMFYAEVAFTVLPELAFTWRVYVRAEGFLGVEVM